MIAIRQGPQHNRTMQLCAFFPNVWRGSIRKRPHLISPQQKVRNGSWAPLSQ